MICPFLKTLWQFLLRSNTCLRSNAGIPSLVCNKTMSAYIHKTFHSTFIHRSTKWKISQISSIGKRIKQYVYSYHVTLHKMIDKTKWMNHRNNAVWEKPGTRVHIVRFHLFKILTQTKGISSDKSLTVVTVGGGDYGGITWERAAGNFLG